MRDDLVGHLLGAIDAPDAERIEAALADPVSGPDLRRHLELLGRAVAPLALDRDPLAPPPGLASRTLRLTAAGSTAVPPGQGHWAGHPAGSTAADRSSSQRHANPGRHAAPAPAPREGNRWSDDRGGGGEGGMRWVDKAILAATALAACVLLFPATSALVARSRVTRTERNLGRVGQALQGYASSHRRYPSPPDGGPLSRGGLFAPLLVSEHRIVPDDGMLLVPGSALARSGTFRVPTIQALDAARGKDPAAFDELVRSMGGDFGYTLGYRDPMGRLQPIQGLHRSHHPLMADAPDESGERSDNHPDGRHHVLWEDGRVEILDEPWLHDEDHVFKNHDGVTAAGKDPEDAVIGDSHHQP
ncbi:MAG: hypothetical protein KJS77_09110 [Planctomycetes bacterium]|nr:hypothetical protein [Planctomycetota bacterium]